jgi:hypothetical protein
MIYVPLSALSLASESGEQIPPEAGDSVNLSVVGVVKSIKGDQACIDITEANGKPVKQRQAKELNEDEALRHEAMKADLMPI